MTTFGFLRQGKTILNILLICDTQVQYFECQKETMPNPVVTGTGFLGSPHFPLSHTHS